ncbi:hypothetical protein A2697_04265 [Candidatus Curtissbacteria bacterium RIFCSPHIGHO2_01_FULL_41_44]|uniref:Methyltransferase type 11 domain-containing protein n=1 Tax=Candidatus Curtissbacteria bacterium RIFCSPLOWO2_01_FULL_42_50 TaxID=1797730 RepID=A0A1F5H2L1_9BACT|nr:MAG: hypothetical protein A3C33_04210 [Candidatus Curtissbacteria bacterium RIFCSPHIGHO2_02_FULL_42_58]OGD93775.1 MAG: hypothetical protein A2697_04265 [Candidatus Curtissbacteria bacterium RIFCSPHIGHO2_01_FULL_41_44]OGD97274.1 MAG: hypothetical protein A3E71_04420 [Candidatus Curtissbacteria bacterium RIFCSPHIGHO2_12_FULL_42_33]OGD98402.1 MAG: hypothetical protein A3B54_03630 [Candidatus Curtissbacteria bacterium RIFCSPLOWO2_01_FULL_42_50]OGE02320.1 MAG: hypothetical protein A3G16_03770 [Ca
MLYSKIKTDLKRVYDDLSVYWGKDESLHDWGVAQLEEFASMIQGNKPGLWGNFQTRFEKVKKKPKVLDLGCGSGVQLKMLAGLGLSVVGLDLSPKMIKEAQIKAPKAKFVVGDMSNMKFAKNSFDGVYARASLLHIPKKLIPKVLSSIYKILKKKGVLYLAVKEGEGENEVEDEKHGQKVKRFFSFFQMSELESFLEEAGFKIIKATKFKRAKISTNWLQVFAKKA